MISTLLARSPRFITVDFKPAWHAAIRVVFPLAKIIICTFHAIQLLTRALLKEFRRLRHKLHGRFVKEALIARKLSLSLEKGEKIDKKHAFKDDVCKRWFDFFQKLVDLRSLKTIPAFENGFKRLVKEIKSWNLEIGTKFEQTVAPSLPKRGFTTKNISRFKDMLCTKWRKVLLEMREDREEQKKRFTRRMYMMLKKPGNMEQWEKDKLESFLIQNPSLTIYRETLLRYYDMLDDPRKNGTSLSFLNDIISEESHGDLKAAVKTLQSFETEIFNFVRAWDKIPHLNGVRAIKVNPEPQMRILNDAVRDQFSFRTDDAKVFRVSKLFSCPVGTSKTIIAEKEGVLI